MLKYGGLELCSSEVDQDVPFALVKVFPTCFILLLKCSRNAVRRCLHVTAVIAGTLTSSRSVFDASSAADSSNGNAGLGRNSGNVLPNLRALQKLRALFQTQLQTILHT